MKYRLVLVALAIGVAFQAYADDRSVPGSTQPTVPRLGDLMGMTQLRHIKLWYAGNERNWNLANYELEQIKYSFQDTMAFYPGLPLANMTTLAQPAERIGEAIRAKDKAKFTKAFTELTSACNACHESQGYGFIVIKVPNSSPFSDELFPPK